VPKTCITARRYGGAIRHGGYVVLVVNRPHPLAWFSSVGGQINSRGDEDTMRAMSEKQSSDEVRRHLEESRRLGKEANRSADAVVRHLRRAAELLRQSGTASNRS
jgi:hypothetical protein